MKKGREICKEEGAGKWEVYTLAVFLTEVSHILNMSLKLKISKNAKIRTFLTKNLNRNKIMIFFYNI